MKQESLWFPGILGAQNPCFPKKHDVVLGLGRRPPPLPLGTGRCSGASYQLSQLFTRQVGLREIDKRASADVC